MPDLIIKKQDTGNIAVSTTTQNVVIQATPTNSYVLPPATANTLGGVIVGANLSITGNGVLSANIPTGGVTAFNNRTGNVTLTANDVISAAVDPVKSNPNVYVRSSTIPYGLTTATANYPQGGASASYAIYSNASNAPYYKDAIVWVSGCVTISGGSSVANVAGSAVGSFRVQFQTSANLPVFAGTTNKITGFELVHWSGTPYLRMIGQPQAAAWADVANVPPTYMLTKEQCMLFFLTQGLADQLYEAKRKVNE